MSKSLDRVWIDNIPICSEGKKAIADLITAMGYDIPAPIRTLREGEVYRSINSGLLGIMCQVGPDEYKLIGRSGNRLIDNVFQRNSTTDRHLIEFVADSHLTYPWGEND